jgi:biopolymer transport protein ExbB/TolQ
MNTRYRHERTLGIVLLVGIALLVHLTYTFYVRPEARRWQEVHAAATEGPAPRRSLAFILKDPEQEGALILFLWAATLCAFKFREVSRERAQLARGLLRIPDGYRILPADVREYSRALDALGAAERDRIPARTIRRALKRFGETANVQDAATTVHDFCESEAARLDSELALIRFSVWAIPALGFVGTVRGIGLALQGAQVALRGDTGPVTSGLGIAFNSTFVALILSIVLMYLVHELQRMQERLVLDVESWVDETVISALQSS